MLEGLRLCRDALEKGAAVQEVFLAEGLEQTPEGRALLARAPGCLLGRAAAEKIAQTSHSQGVFALCRMPEPLRWEPKAAGRYLICCSLQDPGNLGTILRTAAALGMDGLFLTEDCPDLYSPKVLRASMGGVFSLPVRRCPDAFAAIDSCRRAHLTVLAAALHRDAVPLPQCRLEGACVVIGNEGRGLPPAVTEACDGTVIIPMRPGEESLNAAMAAGILMWEMCRGGGLSHG